MAVDVTLATITSGFDLSKINDNFTAIDTALQDAVSRSGTLPNNMTADLDFNSNDLLNVDSLAATSMTLNGQPVTTTNLSTLDPNSVNTAAIQDGAVTSAKILDGTITEAKLASSSVTSAKKSAATIAKDEGFKTVALLLADTDLTYTTSQSGTVAAGDVIKAGGFDYEVLSSAATDHHVTTSHATTPVKLRVLPIAGVYPADAWGLTTDGSGDNSTVLENLRLFLREQSTSDRPAAIFFTTDTTIAATTFPNWAIYNALILGNGVTFRNTGTGNTLIFDATTQPGYSGQAYNTVFVDFFVEGESTSGHGVFCKGAHHARIKGEVRGCGTTKNALEVDGAVLSTFEVVASVNRGAFYDSGTPLRGMNLTECYACEFPMAIVEGVSAQGIRLNSGSFNNFRFGSSEGNAGTNIEFGASTTGNFVWGMDFEVPGNGQGIIDRGRWNTWNCVTDDSLMIITSTAIGTKVMSGSFNGISDSGAGSRFRDITYAANGGTYTALGAAVDSYRMTDPYNIVSASFTQSTRRRERFGSGATKIAEGATVITVGSSGTPASVPGNITYGPLSFPGVRVNDIVHVGVPAALTNNYIIHAKCDVDDQVKVIITQLSGSAASPLPSGANLRISYSRWDV